ncbi:MAG: hypothetical protein LUE64_04655, partial [Candidatus Gastranaerophilales bacterium]|nr:hypothetical protein [Candidatus Gastranaerophilales bacterium]
IICFKVNDIKGNFYIAVSTDSNPIKLYLPENKNKKCWHLIADTKKNYINLKGARYKEKFYTLLPFSASIFKEKGGNLPWI